MLRITALACVMFTAAALAAPAPLPKRGKVDAGSGDLQKMQGEWEVTQRLSGGSPISSGTMTAVVIGDRIKFLLNGEARTEWAITLDVTKSPKVIDRKRTWGAGKAKEVGEIVLRGIYKLEGNTWTISFYSSGAGDKRPTDFTGKGTGEWLSVMTRKSR